LCADRGELERTLLLAARHLAIGDEPRPARFWAGIRTHAADARFVIGPDPDVEGVVWCGALGGHGITCAEPVGRIAADWVLDGASAHPLSGELHPARFALPQVAAVV
jgi:glycine/D-amino acid oxidase-like deaminating enzyme